MRVAVLFAVLLALLLSVGCPPPGKDAQFPGQPDGGDSGAGGKP
jgi:hypothetical protein